MVAMARAGVPVRNNVTVCVNSLRSEGFVGSSCEDVSPSALSGVGMKFSAIFSHIVLASTAAASRVYGEVVAGPSDEDEADERRGAVLACRIGEFRGENARAKLPHANTHIKESMSVDRGALGGILEETRRQEATIRLLCVYEYGATIRFAGLVCRSSGFSCLLFFFSSFLCISLSFLFYRADVRTAGTGTRHHAPAMAIHCSSARAALSGTCTVVLWSSAHHLLGAALISAPQYLLRLFLSLLLGNSESAREVL